MADIRIIDVQKEHIPEIFKIANSYQVQDPNVDIPHSEGFLVSNFRKNDYLRFLDTAEYYFAAADDSTVQGFLLGFSQSGIGGNSFADNAVQDYANGPFIIVKQICVRKGSSGLGIGTALYENLFRKIPKTPVFAAIVTDPANVASIEFHTKLGFTQVLRITPPDGIPRSIWRK